MKFFKSNNLFGAAIVVLALVAPFVHAADISLLNVTIRQSHGGFGAQARSVIDGLDADVVTLPLTYDVDAIAEKAHAIDPNWQNALPITAYPTLYHRFLVRKGNPKGIRDWDDLAKSDIKVITANLKTSEGAKWNH